MLHVKRVQLLGDIESLRDNVGAQLFRNRLLAAFDRCKYLHIALSCLVSFNWTVIIAITIFMTNCVIRLICSLHSNPGVGLVVS